MSSSLTPDRPRPGSAAQFYSLAIPGILAGFLLASAAFDFSGTLGVFNFKRVAQGVVLLFIFLPVLVNREIRTEFGMQIIGVPRWMAGALVLAFSLAVISALRFPHPGYGLAETALLGLSVSACLLLAACRRLAGTRFDQLVMGMVALMGLAVAVQEFMGLLAGWALGVEFSYQQMLIRFAHPRFWNQLQSWTIPVLAALPFVFGASPRWRIMAIACLGLQWFILIMSGGRGSVIAILSALLLVLIVSRGWSRTWFRTHLAGLLLGILTYSTVLLINASSGQGDGAYLEQSVARPMLHTTGRTHLWSMALDDARQHPWLGAGPARYNCDGLAVHPAHPHNFPLRILAEWGIPATTLLLLVCVAIGWRLLQWLHAARTVPVDPGTHALNTMLIAATMSAGLHAGVSGVLMMPASQLMAALVCGWLLGRWLSQRTHKPGTGGTQSGLVLGLVAALAAGAVNAFNLAELRQLPIRIQDLDQQGPAQPRYWQHGRTCEYVHAGDDAAGGKQ